uniref:Uncharacterized protein n=1 Tax=Oryza brachyantha TaxID=4533 RepID=J3N8R4_ORYBR
MVSNGDKSEQPTRRGNLLGASAPAGRRARISGGDKSSRRVGPVLAQPASRLPLPAQRPPPSADESLSGFELYYDVASGDGLWPLPGDVSHLLMGSDIHHLLDQFSWLEATAPRPSASKAAVELMSSVTVAGSGAHCAVCRRRLSPALPHRRCHASTSTTRAASYLGSPSATPAPSIAASYWRPPPPSRRQMRDSPSPIDSGE